MKREIFASYAGWVGGESNEQYHNDSVFLSTLDTKSDHLLSTPATRTSDEECYFSRDRTIENIHIYEFIAKTQAHILDNLNYGDVQRCTPIERKIWDETMVKELKLLRDLGSFKMVAQSNDANILQSTWIFKWKIYPDGVLKNYKARFYVR